MVETFYWMDFLSKWSAMFLLWPIMVISEKKKKTRFVASLF